VASDRERKVLINNRISIVFYKLPKINIPRISIPGTRL